MQSPVIPPIIESTTFSLAGSLRRRVTRTTVNSDGTLPLHQVIIRHVTSHPLLVQSAIRCSLCNKVFPAHDPGNPECTHACRALGSVRFPRAGRPTFMNSEEVHCNAWECFRGRLSDHVMCTGHDEEREALRRAARRAEIREERRAVALGRRPSAQAALLRGLRGAEPWTSDETSTSTSNDLTRGVWSFESTSRSLEDDTSGSYGCTHGVWSFSDNASSSHES